MIYVSKHDEDSGTFESRRYDTCEISSLFNDIFKNISDTDGSLCELKGKFDIDNAICKQINDIQYATDLVDKMTIKLFGDILKIQKTDFGKDEKQEVKTNE